MADDKGKYSKVEREIMEILDDVGSKNDDRPRNVVEFRRPRRSRFPKYQRPDLSELRYALSPAKLLLVILVAIVGAVFLQDVPFVSPVLVVIAIAAFAGVFFARSRPSIGSGSPKSPGVKRWRGRDIDLSNRK